MEVGNAPEHVQQIFADWNLPLGLLRLLQWSWPQKDFCIGPVDILCALRVGTQTGMEELLASKFIRVGDAPNGDTFVIDFSVDSCVVGFIAHEGYEETSDPREFFCPVARSVESFLYRATEERYIPGDYYEAGDFNQFLQEEAEHENFPPYNRRSS